MKRKTPNTETDDFKAVCLPARSAPSRIIVANAKYNAIPTNSPANPASTIRIVVEFLRTNAPLTAPAIGLATRASSKRFMEWSKWSVLEL